jgi:hypothetical protein
MGAGLVASLVLLAGAPAALAQPSPTPTPPSPTELPDGGETTVTVEETDKGSGPASPSSNPDRPPGSEDSTDDVTGDVPEPEPTPTTNCEQFRYRQAYRSWGPARAYGRKVSVLYEADRCVRIDRGVLRITMDGTAEVREGGRSGDILQKRPFELQGTWVHPSIEDGWPPDWWQCGVADLDYVWRIAGRYTFSVEAEDGRWRLEVVTVHKDRTRTVTWTYDACR